MSLYIDTSCLLKLFFAEPESARVNALVAEESRVVVSSLSLVEFDVRLHRLVHERQATPSTSRRLRARLDALLGRQPFERVEFLPEYFALAQKQTRAKGAVYCKALDRLHLAAMQSLRLRRLLTNDTVQAAAAKAHGITSIMPRA